MSTNRVRCAAPPGTVFRVLGDARQYGYFVVGNRTIRRFDPTWPEPGSTFHHSLGVVVPLIRDHTRSLEVVDGRRVAMRTFMRPLAVNDVSFELVADGDGTLVEIVETPIAGPAAIPLLRSLTDRLLWLRNVVVCRRLRRVVEKRAARQQLAAGVRSAPGTGGGDA